MERMAAILLAALLLAGCGTPYGRDTGYGGYQDSAVEKNLFRVAYTAPNNMDGKAVHDLALYRAAQVCRQHGCAVFTVVRENTGVTRRLQLSPPEPAAYYDTPVVEPGTPARGPRVVYVPEPAWGSGVPESYAVPAAYSELYIRVYPTAAAAKQDASSAVPHDVAQVLKDLGAQYKLSP